MTDLARIRAALTNSLALLVLTRVYGSWSVTPSAAGAVAVVAVVAWLPSLTQRSRDDGTTIALRDARYRLAQAGYMVTDPSGGLVVRTREQATEAARSLLDATLASTWLDRGGVARPCYRVVSVGVVRRVSLLMEPTSRNSTLDRLRTIADMAERAGLRGDVDDRELNVDVSPAWWTGMPASFVDEEADRLCGQRDERVAA